MPILPLAQFIPRALADRTVEETIRDAILSGRGPGRGPGPYPPHQPRRGILDTRKLGPTDVQAPPVGVGAPPGLFGGGDALPGALIESLSNGMGVAGGGQTAAPVQPPGNWDLQDMGDLPPGPTYPHVQPQVPQSVGPAMPQPQRAPTAQDFMQPQRQPSSQDFGVSPVQPQQPQQGGLSDPGMWGLLAAGLGILANNSGHYGNWQPAVGKGGLIGVNTFLNQRQQGIENVRRDELAKAEAARWAQQAEYNKFLIGQGQTKAAREQEIYDRRKLILEQFKPSTEAEKLLLELAPEEFAKLKAKEAEGFTLTEGAQRYDAAGKKLAENPKEPKTPEGMRLRADGTYEWDKEYLKGKKEIAGSGASKIEVKQGEAFTKPISESVDSSFKQAQSAIQAQGTLNRLSKNLEDPNLIAGVGANKRMTLAQIKQFFGGGSDQGLAVTRSTIQGLAELTLNSRGMLQGQGQITEKEQALLERARGGDIEMSVPELKELVSVLGRMQRAQYDSHQQTLKRLEQVPGGDQAGKFFVPQPFPEPYAPGSGKKDPWK